LLLLVSAKWLDLLGRECSSGELLSRQTGIHLRRIKGLGRTAHGLRGPGQRQWRGLLLRIGGHHLWRVLVVHVLLLERGRQGRKVLFLLTSPSVLNELLHLVTQVGAGN
jgi:hypothetical protein